MGTENMILEEETFRKFRYYPSDLSLRSGKIIIVQCDDCGEIRENTKHQYRPLCKHCVIKGDRNILYKKHLSEETKQKIGDANRGHKHNGKTKQKIGDAFRNKKLSEEHKRKIKENHADISGENHPNYGKHLSEETKRKISEGNKGKVNSLEARVKISIALKGRNGGGMTGKCHTPESKKKMSDAQKGNKNHNYGKPKSEEIKRKMSESSRGEKASNWRGGISFGKYCPKFNETFKERIRDKFDHKCFLCGIPENGRKLSVHHVNYSKNCLCSDDNSCQFVPLCPSCHSKTNANREYWQSLIMGKLSQRIDGYYI